MEPWYNQVETSTYIGCPFHDNYILCNKNINNMIIPAMFSTSGGPRLSTIRIHTGPYIIKFLECIYIQKGPATRKVRWYHYQNNLLRKKQCQVFTTRIQRRKGIPCQQQRTLPLPMSIYQNHALLEKDEPTKHNNSTTSNGAWMKFDSKSCT